MRDDDAVSDRGRHVADIVDADAVGAGGSVTVSCGVGPAGADVVELVIAQAVAPFGVPIPRPIATLGDTADSVTVTVPCWATVNVERLEPCTPTVPPNVSLDAGRATEYPAR